MPQPATLQSALLDATRVLGAMMSPHAARLQAELLLAHVLGETRAWLLARLDATLAPDVAARYAANVARRARDEPLAYILGHQEFYGLDFLVDRRALIPRYETETLVQLACVRARQMRSPVIVDVGTGSGAIALALAQHLADARLIATDSSRDALDLARLNAQRLGLAPRVVFVESDLLERVTDPFDLLVANLPYIPTARVERLPREIRAFEPRRALDGGADGLEVLRRLLAQLPARAARGARALLEISEEQGDAAQACVRRAWPHAVTTLHRDLEGLDRVIEIEWSEDANSLVN